MIKNFSEIKNMDAFGDLPSEAQEFIKSLDKIESTSALRQYMLKEENMANINEINILLRLIMPNAVNSDVMRLSTN